MSKYFAAHVLLGVIGVASLGSASYAQTSTKPLGREQRRIVTSVETMFHAMDSNDRGLLNSVIEPDFYLFDAGKRFDSQSITALIQHLKASGTAFEWHVTDPDVHIAGTTAWVAYVDRGSMTDATGRTNKTWLESAFLIKRAGRWRLAFMQSTPAAENLSAK